MLSTDPIEELKRRFNAQAARDITANYLLCINGLENGPWLTKINCGKLEVMQFVAGSSPNPDCTISISAEDLELIMNGKLSAMTAAMSGMLAIDGELGLAMQLVPIFFNSPVF